MSVAVRPAPSRTLTDFAARLKALLGISAGHIRRIRELIIRHARWRGCHGVICGHIHEPMTLPPHTSHTIAACRNDFTGSAQVGMNS